MVFPIGYEGNLVKAKLVLLLASQLLRGDVVLVW